MTLGLLYSRKHLAQEVRWLCAAPRLIWLLIGIGIFLRLIHYIANRSLRFDEAAVSLNIISRSFAQLREPLDNIQLAPFGFLALEKLAVECFGNNEYALRLFPFLFGVASLFLFYAVAKDHLRPQALLIALALFAISHPVVRFASEVKQYSGDIAIALLLLLITTRLLQKGLPARWLPIYAIVGAASVWFSHPAALVLAGMGTTLGLICFIKKDWPKLALLAGVYIVWVVSFSFTLPGSTTEAFGNEGIVERVSPLFLPFPPTSLADGDWYFKTFFVTFSSAGGIFLTGIAAFAFVIGCASLFRANRESLLLLISPIIFTLAASALGKYPLPGPEGLGARFSLFMSPFLFLFIGAGTHYFFEKVRSASMPIAVAFIVFLLFTPVLSAAEKLGQLRHIEEIKPAMSYIKEHRRPEDRILVLRPPQPAFIYYADKYGLEESDYFMGQRPALEQYVHDLEGQQADARVFILIAHATRGGFYLQRDLLLTNLDSVANRTESIEKPGVELHVYDLKSDPVADTIMSGN